MAVGNWLEIFRLCYIFWCTFCKRTLTGGGKRYPLPKKGQVPPLNHWLPILWYIYFDIRILLCNQIFYNAKVFVRWGNCPWRHARFFSYYLLCLIYKMKRQLFKMCYHLLIYNVNMGNAYCALFRILRNKVFTHLINKI